MNTGSNGKRLVVVHRRIFHEVFRSRPAVITFIFLNVLIRIMSECRRRDTEGLLDMQHVMRY